MAYFLTNAARRRVSVGSIGLAGSGVPGIDLLERKIPEENRRELDVVTMPPFPLFARVVSI
jgi:hypothetical protein